CRNSANWWNCDRSGTTYLPPTFGIEKARAITEYCKLWLNVADAPIAEISPLLEEPPAAAPWVAQSSSSVRFVVADCAYSDRIRESGSALTGMKKVRSTV